MLGKKGVLLITCLFFIVVALTGEARRVLDDLTAPFRNDFREMHYLPRGKGLKVVACGFDAPLADALFIKSLVYFGGSMQVLGQSSARRAYTYELFDVITDLSPRFYRAYQIGSLFLTASSSLETNLNGVRLLEKGIATTTNLESAGEKLSPDPRWLYHLLLATAFELNVQSRLREQGDLEGAAAARDRVAEEYRLSAASKGAPPFVTLAAIGLESIRRGRGNVEDARKASLAVWRELHEQAAARGDKEVQDLLTQSIEETEDSLMRIADTRYGEKFLSDAGRVYRERYGKPPARVMDLLRAGLVPSLPANPMGNLGGNAWLALPDGSFKNRDLAQMESDSHLDLLSDAVIRFKRSEDRNPDDLQELVGKKYLDHVPEPPLAGLGQRYDYDPKSGLIRNRLPLGPELPPDAF